jgi:uncharacterized protein (TIRG00374 family)
VTPTATDPQPAVAGRGSNSTEAKGPKIHRPGRRAINVLVGVAVVALVFTYLLPRIADYDTVWRIVESLEWPWLLALAVAAVLVILCDAPPWMAVLPGLSFLNALRMDLAGSALSQIAPGGAALNAATQYGMLRSWGYGRRPVALAVSLTTIWNQLFVFGAPIIALAALALSGGRNRALAWVAFVGLAVFAAILAALAVGLSSKRLAKNAGDTASRAATWVKRLVHARPVRWNGDGVVSFRGEAIDLLQHRWAALTVTTLANQLTVFVVLVVALRAVGITRAEVGVVEAFAAWTLVRALGSIPLTPGGLGVIEIALSGALVGFGAHNAQAVAATLVYRFATLVPAIVLGLASVATYNLGRPKQNVVARVARWPRSGRPADAH